MVQLRKILEMIGNPGLGKGITGYRRPNDSTDSNFPYKALMELLEILTYSEWFPYVENQSVLD